MQWSAIVILGAIPLGAGFYAWDYGCKHGDIMILGALSYAAPLFSVLVLLLAGFGVFHWSVGLACALVTIGALIAAKDMLLKVRPAGFLRNRWCLGRRPLAAPLSLELFAHVDSRSTMNVSHLSTRYPARL